MRHLTTFEALTFLGETFNTSPDCIASGLVDATVAPMSVDRARADLDSYLATLPDDIDPDTIKIQPDYLDDSDMDCVRIVIRTEVSHG